MQTNLSSSLETAGIQARYDAACKTLLANKEILAWILKSVVSELADYKVSEIAECFIEGEPQISAIPIEPGHTNSVISGMNGEDIVLHEGKVLFDIRFFAKFPSAHGMTKILVDVEAQNRFHPGYDILKRGIFYGSRMISAQCGTEFVQPHYDDIKHVYSIWICMNPPDRYKNTARSFRLKPENLVGKAEDEPAVYDLLTVTRICLGDAEGENYHGLIKLLDVLLSERYSVENKRQILEHEFDIRMSVKLERELMGMCDLSEGVLQRGYERGIRAGIRDGLQQGIQQGIRQSEKTGAFALISSLKRFGVSEEQIREELIRNEYGEKYLDLYKLSR